MSRTKRTFVRLAGYPPEAIASYLPTQIQFLVHSAWTIIVAAVVTATSWGLAAWNLAGGTLTPAPIGVGVSGAFAGMLLVFSVDRAMLYAGDTGIGKVWPRRFLMLIRMATTLAVGTFSATAVAPFVMRPELEAASLAMREESDAHRTDVLAKRFGLLNLNAAVEKAAAEVAEANRNLNTAPPDIKARLSEARACSQTLATRILQRQRSGKTLAEARRELAGLAQTCRGKTAAAVAALNEYRRRAREVVVSTNARESDARAEVDTAQKTIKSRLVEGITIERNSIVPTSAAVLAYAARADLGVRIKLLSFVLLLELFECLPMVIGLLGAKTIMGIAIAVDQELAEHALESKREVALDNRLRERSIRVAMASAMDVALADPDIQRAMAAEFALRHEALIPLHVARELFVEIDAAASELSDVSARNPDAIRELAEIWRQALADLLTRLNPKTLTPEAA